MFEVLAVSTAIIMPYYVWAIAGLVETGCRPFGRYWSLTNGILVIAYRLPVIILLCWVLSITGEPAAHFGWVRLRPIKDVIVAAGLALMLMGAMGIFGSIVPAGQSSDPALRAFLLGTVGSVPRGPSGSIEWPVYVVAQLAIATGEELSIRSYLGSRLETLFRSRPKAALASSAAWASYHVYQGLIPVGIHFVEGLLLAFAFFKFRRLWPLVLAHAGVNLLLPVLTAR